MLQTIDDRTAAQLADDRKVYGTAVMRVHPDGRIERVEPRLLMRGEVESPRERHGDGL